MALHNDAQCDVRFVHGDLTARLFPQGHARSNFACKSRAREPVFFEENGPENSNFPPSPDRQPCPPLALRQLSGFPPARAVWRMPGRRRTAVSRPVGHRLAALHPPPKAPILGSGAEG